jgi:hypothetical protein
MAMDNPNYKSSDYARLEEHDRQRRFINQYSDRSALNSTNKYNIGKLEFPENVNSDDYPHYVSFFINIRGKSQFNKENRFKDQAILAPGGTSLTPDEINSAINLLATGAGGVLGVGAVKKFAGLKAGQQVKAGGGSQKKIDLASENAKASGKSQLLGGALGAAAGFGVTWLGTKYGPDIITPDKSYRISDVITLAVQEPPAVSYDAKYNDTALGMVLGALGRSAGMLEQGKAMSTMAEAGVLGLSTLAGAALGAKAGGGLGGAALGAAGGALAVTGPAVQAMTKMRTNPFREMLFEQTDYRQFKFNYKFLPKNRNEVDNIKRIVDLFKFHMHPELSTGNLFFIYPAEFQIVYYFKGKENSYFHKIAPSALTNLSVSYGSGSGMSSFHDGAPTEVNISLSFQELELLTKEKIQLGY